MNNFSDTRVPTPRVLLLTHDAAEAGRIVRRLGEGGIGAQLEHVASLGSFATACAAAEFELILVDLDLPDTGAWRALKTARRQCPRVPVVLLASPSAEDVAAQMAQHGVAGVVPKNKGEELLAVIERSIREQRREAAGPVEQAPDLSDLQSVHRLLAEQIQDVVCLHGPDRRIGFVTPSVFRLLGYPPEEWGDHLLSDFVHAEDAGRLQTAFEAAASARDRGQTVIGRYRHRQGHFVWMETKVQAICDREGTLVQLISVSRDCLDRRQVEESLRRGEQLFEGIAEANRLLLTARQLSESITAVLRVLGRAAGAERVLLCEFQRHAISGRPVCTLFAEWVDDAVDMPSATDMFEVAIPDAGASLAIEAGQVPAGMSNLLEQRGLEDVLLFAIPVHDSAWGAIGFHRHGASEAWSSTVSSALGIVAFNIGQAIDREEGLAALAESEKRYEELLGGLSEAVFQIDLQGRWHFLNPTWEELTGFPVEESIGQRFSSYMADEEASEALEGFGRLVSGREVRIEEEIRFRHRLGRELWLRVVAQPQFNGAGRVVGVSGTLVDVTQRRHAMAAMRESERKFTAVFEASSDALFLVARATGLIVECNPRALEMFECASAADLVGNSSESLRHLPSREVEFEEGLARLNRGEVWSDEMQFVTCRGRVFWGLFSVVRMEPDHLGTSLLRITDIAERKDSEERLRASLGEKEVLLKEVYHRVKNNLQIISALLRMQARRVKDRVAMEALENSISRVMAMSMVHEKLYQAQNLVSIDFLSFAQSLVGFLNQLTIGSQAGVTISVEGDPLALSIDQAIPLGLILNELVTNSLKYAFPDGRGGHVSISIGSHAQGAARITVADNGIGLGKGLNIDESAGLGFRIVRMLVEQLHGGLELESRGGLTVAVRVPPPIFRPRELGL